MTSLRSLIEQVPFLKYFFTLAAVTLVWREEFDTTVVMVIVIPMDEFLDPCPGIINSSESSDWIAWTVFEGFENGLRIRIVIANPGATTRRRNPQ